MTPHAAQLREALEASFDFVAELWRRGSMSPQEIAEMRVKITAALSLPSPSAWLPIEDCPTNRRVYAYGNDEEAMVWKDQIDGKFYYAPQGGLLTWEPTHWMDLHPAPPRDER